jgi:ubiquinone/menaquinone biosynthesis C-methylase UbiE
MAFMQLFSPFCPSCRESLLRDGDSFTCSKCGRVYPLKNGLVDFLTSLPLSDVQREVQKGFDTAASAYDDTTVRLVESLGCPWSAYTAKLETFMAQAGGKVILDVGCGTSFPVGSFVPGNSIYLGMDVSAEMLAHAKSLFGKSLNVSLWNINAERIPLADNSVDLCLALLVFNAFSDPQKCAEEIKRVLKKDGGLYGTVFYQNPPEDLAFEKPVSPQLIQNVFSIFDPGQWNLTVETLGGILFFYMTRRM